MDNIGNFDALRKMYAEKETTWKANFREAFDEYRMQPGFDELEFIYHAGIKPNEWVRLCTKNAISNNPFLYAKIFYHMGIEEADPRELPPRLHVQFGEQPSGKSRSITNDRFVQWVSGQKPAFNGFFKAGVGLANNDAHLKWLATVLALLLKGDAQLRHDFSTKNRKLLAFIVPILTAVSMDRADRERELHRLVTLQLLQWEDTNG